VQNKSLELRTKIFDQKTILTYFRDIDYKSNFNRRNDFALFTQFVQKHDHELFF